MALKLSEAAKEARRAYKREWNRKNRDKVKAATARYWEKRAREAGELPEGEPTAREAGA